MSDINEDAIQIVVDAVRQYYDQITDQSATAQSAYLGQREAPTRTFDFTGLITMAGNLGDQLEISVPVTIQGSARALNSFIRSHLPINIMMVGREAPGRLADRGRGKAGSIAYTWPSQMRKPQRGHRQRAG